jgi:hypothetical protein
LERSRSNGVTRLKVLVVIASLVAFLLWLLGTAAEAAGLEQRMRPGSRKRRAYSRLFLARLILTLDSCCTSLDEVIASTGAADQWVADHHDAPLAS